MPTDTVMKTDTVTYDGDDRAVTITMNSDQARTLRDFLDTVDISDIRQNPDYHGLTSDDATDFADVLGLLATALGRVYPY